MRFCFRVAVLGMFAILQLCYSFNPSAAFVASRNYHSSFGKKDQVVSQTDGDVSSAISSGSRISQLSGANKRHSFSSLNAAAVAGSDNESSISGDASVPVDLPLFGSVTLPRIFWKSLWMLVCIIWATNFPVIKSVYSSVGDGDLLDASMFIALRFSIASLLLLPGSWRRLKDVELAKSGLLVGLSIFVAYVGQSIGIQVSSASKAAFICSMNVVWVTLVNAISKKVFRLRSWIAVALAVLGCAFIELKGHVVPQIGDLWLFLQPIGFGTGYLLLESGMKRFPDDANAFTAFKLLGVAILAWCWAFIRGHTFADVIPIFSNPVAATGILYTSFVTTAIAIWLQSVVFKNVPATDASIILTTEPVWASAFAYFLLKESFTRSDFLGGGLIVLGCLYNEIDVIAQLRRFARVLNPFRLLGAIGKKGDGDASRKATTV